MATFGYQREFFTMTPEAFGAIAVAQKNGGRGAIHLSMLLSTLIDWADEHGEVEAVNSVLCDVIGINASSMSKLVKFAVEHGFIEYRLRRGKRGNLYRLNPELFCVIPRRVRGISEIKETNENGETMMSHKIRGKENDKYVVLIKRYQGKSLRSHEVIAHQRKVAAMVTNSNSAVPLH